MLACPGSRHLRARRRVTPIQALVGTATRTLQENLSGQRDRIAGARGLSVSTSRDLHHPDHDKFDEHSLIPRSAPKVTGEGCAWQPIGLGIYIYIRTCTYSICIHTAADMIACNEIVLQLAAI